jgi:hypothetical protein
VPSGNAPSYPCRAWVNFNGTGTVAIRASGNVSSITDNGTGDYTVNFTTAMPDANYSVSVTVRTIAVGTGSNPIYDSGSDATKIRIIPFQTQTQAAVDTDYGLVAVFR